MVPNDTVCDQPKMKTLLVVPWDTERGGVVSVGENLAKYLQARGHGVLFCHPGRNVVLKTRTTKLGFDGVQLKLNVPFTQWRPILSTLAFPILFPVALLQLIWLLRKHRIQIVNLHYPTDNFFYFAICRRLLAIRLVTSVHGRDAFYRGKPKVRFSRIFRFLLRSSDLIVLPSDRYRKELLEVFPALRDKTIFIHNGVNPVLFTPAEDPDVRHENGRYVLCVADLTEYKGIDVLLHASKPLLTSDPSLRLVLAGDGPMREELETLALSLGIRSQIQFLGAKGAKEIVRLLQGCEILVLPSREEPFGIVIIEAMACKKPVVASLVGGIPEIIEHEKNGILVDPENPAALADGLRRVLLDSDLKRVLAENGYARVMERFCFTHNGSAYETAFTSLLGFPRPVHSSSEISTVGTLSGLRK
jgi:glycosyltransferase involved in cell wall biosynthesis